MLFIFALSWPFSWKLPIWMLNAGSIDILFLIFPFLSPSHRFNSLLRHFYLLPYSGCVLHAFYSVTTNETSILFETKCRKHCCSRSLSLSSSHRFAHMFESLRGGQDENILCRMHYEWMKALKGLHTYERLFNLSLSLSGAGWVRSFVVPTILDVFCVFHLQSNLFFTLYLVRLSGSCCCCCCCCSFPCLNVCE